MAALSASTLLTATWVRAMTPAPKPTAGSDIAEASWRNQFGPEVITNTLNSAGGSHRVCRHLAVDPLQTGDDKLRPWLKSFGLGVPGLRESSSG
jgi:hypothetical protein